MNAQKINPKGPAVAAPAKTFRHRPVRSAPASAPRTIVITAGEFMAPVPREADHIALGELGIRPDDLAGWLIACVRPLDRVVLCLDLDLVPTSVLEAVFHRNAADLLDEVYIRLPRSDAFRPDVRRLRTLLERWAGPALIDDEVRVYAAA